MAEMISEMTAEEIIKELPKGLIKWCEFGKDRKALYITGHSNLDSSLQETLSECGLYVEVTDRDHMEMCSGKYAYILIATAIERNQSEEAAVSLLKKARTLMEEYGKLFLVTENRMAVRYFCGDRDPYTRRNFDGIENYRRAGMTGKDAPEGKLYSKGELEKMLESAGFFHHKFYSVFPEIECPQILCAEDYLPDEELGIRIFPQYRSPETVFLEEEYLYTSMIESGLFHGMANGFVIECPLDGSFEKAKQITVSMDRGRKNALCTIMAGDGVVVKKPLYREGIGKLEQLKKNHLYLQLHGIKVIDCEIVNQALRMPWVNGISLVTYFRRLLTENLTDFLTQFDNLWNLICHSSEFVDYEEIRWEHFNPWWDEMKDEKKRQKIDRSKWRKIAFGTLDDRENLGPILRRGYIDLVLLNGFLVDGEFVFFDQELYVENLPAKAILLRSIDLLYHGAEKIEYILPRKELMARYQIEPCQEIYYAFIRHFLTRLRNDDILSEYHRARRRNNETIHSNRQRMNYSAEEYQRLFVEIFKNTENKKLYLFGSGNFTKKFLALYQSEYEIAGILDNNEEKWGTKMEEIPIVNPQVIKDMDPSGYKVIICIKNYVEVLRQVRAYGATNVGIYDTNMEYPRKQRLMTGAVMSSEGIQKKYHTGYVAGVFDLFHIGHLNLLRRAKEQCDYLIVGVVTDEGVRKNKGAESFIPFDERLAIVQACQYVDEAVGIPLEYCDTKDAYLKFQFDVQFSGSDYAQNAAWLKKQKFLREHGAELVFFPYTETTSSTKIKEMIVRKLV